LDHFIVIETRSPSADEGSNRTGLIERDEIELHGVNHRHYCFVPDAITEMGSHPETRSTYLET
jgi:hypothetical protein